MIRSPWRRILDNIEDAKQKALRIISDRPGLSGRELRKEMGNQGFVMQIGAFYMIMSDLEEKKMIRGENTEIEFPLFNIVVKERKYWMA